jgi:hypothetical protein
MSQSLLDSKPNCCYFWCCIYQRNSSSPWYSRTLCAKILTGLLIALCILIGVPIGLGLLALILSGITYVTQYIIIIDIIPTKPIICGIDHDIFFDCFLPGIMIFTMASLDIALPTAICYPLHIWLYRKKYYKCLVIFNIGLIPVYFIGPELCGVAFYRIFSFTGWALQKCELTSWWNFMSLSCFFQGIYIFTMIWIIELISIGFYFFVKCIRSKCDIYDEYYNNPSIKPSVPVNYETILSNPPKDSRASDSSHEDSV